MFHIVKYKSMNFNRLTENDLMLGDWVMVKERKGDNVKDYPIMVHTGTLTDIVAGNLIVEPRMDLFRIVTILYLTKDYTGKVMKYGHGMMIQ